MSPLAWILGLFLPACAAAGASGLPVPPLLDVAQIEWPASPNTALAAPAGWTPKPDIVTPVYPLPPDRLLAAVAQVAGEQPRTFRAAAYPEALQLHWVVRSAVFNFPDLVTAEAMPHDPAGSTLLLYSRSVYGYGDFGVNRQRLIVWLAALDNAVRPSAERPTPL
jgi:uncharacterized protein (DUF1499 family)